MWFCSKCDWEGQLPRIQFYEAPDMSFHSYQACPVCNAKAFELDPTKMRHNKWYHIGRYSIRWE